MKYRSGKTVSWGIVEGAVLRPVKSRGTVAEIFAACRKKSVKTAGRLPLDSVTALAPTDAGARVFCAGLNYRDHAREINMPLPKSPVFFTKTSGALCGPSDDVVCPEGVRLLDYEVELGLVVGRLIGKEDVVTHENLGEYILGIACFNDVSARDVQLRSGQWFLGKTYRTFAPLGPLVQTIDAELLRRLYYLQLRLQVLDRSGAPYEEKMQNGSTADMLFKAHELVNCLRERFDLLPGDVIATGTPRGVALAKPSRFKLRMAEILGVPQGKRNEKFIAGEIRNNRRYLLQGDTVTAHIFSDDDVVDLGRQRNRVV